MGVLKYAICPHCGKELKRTRENFKRSVIRLYNIYTKKRRIRRFYK